MAKHSLSILFFLFSFLSAAAQPATAADTVEHEVEIETSMGTVRVKLYNETPLHRDNFLRLVNKGFYDGLLIHRVVPRFVIQAGDSLSALAKPGEKVGETKEPYTIPAEIIFPKYYHKCGALAMAREGDDTNPEKASSAYQFYITYGTLYNDSMLTKAQEHLDAATGGKVKLTEEQKKTYRSFGGMPYLDGQYTVFGEVVDGLHIVEEIQATARDKNDRPVKDVKIVKAKQVK